MFEDDEPEDEDDAAAVNAAAAGDKVGAKENSASKDGALDDDACEEDDKVGILSVTNRKYSKLSLGKDEESAFIAPEQQQQKEEEEKVREKQVGNHEPKSDEMKEPSLSPKNPDKNLTEIKVKCDAMNSEEKPTADQLLA